MTDHDKDNKAASEGADLVVLDRLSGPGALAAFEVQPIQSNPALAYLVTLGSQGSRRTMASLLNIIARRIGYPDLHNCDWHQLRRHHVQGIVEWLSQSSRAPATINTYLAALKGVALEAWTMKQIDTDAYQRIKAVRSVRGSRLSKGRALDSEEVRMLFRTCDMDASARGWRDAAILGVLLGCGLRRAEIVALDLEHLDRKEQALKVLGKGNKERISYLPDGTSNRLEKWLTEVRGERPGPLFTRVRRHDTMTWDRLSDQGIYHILEQRREEVNVDAFAPHDLRRTFATNMLDNQEDIITVKDAMGHADVTTTQKYDRRGNDRLKQASRRLSI